MKAVEDTKTIDMIGGLPARRGRPPEVPGLTPSQKKERARIRAAERKAKSRAAKADTHGTLTVTLPLDVLVQFREFLKFKDQTQEEVLERLIRSQLLRKR